MIGNSAIWTALRTELEQAFPDLTAAAPEDLDGARRDEHDRADKSDAPTPAQGDG